VKHKNSNPGWTGKHIYSLTFNKKGFAQAYQICRATSGQRTRFYTLLLSIPSAFFSSFI